jgi:hypothetical protein
VPACTAIAVDARLNTHTHTKAEVGQLIHVSVTNRGVRPSGNAIAQAALLGTPVRVHKRAAG